MYTSVRFGVGFAVLLSLVFVAPAAAQQQLGAVQGTIVDATGAVLPGATITVTNLATGVSRIAISNDSGVYRVPGIEPGRYAVSVELQGFRTVAQNDVTVSVGATLGVNFTMQAGAVSERVDVVSVAPDIQTEKAEISAVVEQKKINDRVGAGGASAGHQRYSEHGRLPHRRAGHGRDRQWRTADRQQRQR